jgi:hypothetical protein
MSDEKEGIDYHAIDNILDRHIEDEFDFSAIAALGVLGLDEIHLKNGYLDFVTLITCLIKDHVHILGVVNGREKTDIKAYLKEIPRRLRKKIKPYVVIYMKVTSIPASQFSRKRYLPSPNGFM